MIKDENMVPCTENFINMGLFMNGLFNKINGGDVMIDTCEPYDKGCNHDLEHV